MSPIASGLSAQVGYGEETTYGTRVVPTRFLEFLSESVVFSPARQESKSLRSGQRILRSDRWAAGKKDVSGSVSHELANKGFSLLFKYALGLAPVITTPTGGTLTREHDCRLGDPQALSLTMQVGRTDIGGVTRPFDYTGVKVLGWEISDNVGDPAATLGFTLDGRDEDTAQALAAASYPASQTLFSWNNLVVQVAGAAFDAKSVSLKGDNSLDTGRYFVGATTKKAPIADKQVEISGKLEGEFTDLTAYNRVRLGTVAAVTLFWTGAVIEGAFNFALEITLPACRFDARTPQVGGPGIVPQQLEFKVLDDGTTNSPIKLLYRTTDTAA